MAYTTTHVRSVKIFGRWFVWSRKVTKHNRRSTFQPGGAW